MTTQSLAILQTGMVTSVGLSAPAACAAIRANLTDPAETRFLASSGEWIMGHIVPLEPHCRGRTKLARMAAMVIEECLAEVPHGDRDRIPMLLCVAERSRPGRIAGLDAELFNEVRELTRSSFAAQSAVFPHGRVSIGLALMHARQLVYESDIPAALIVATDSLLTWPTLKAYDASQRLLTEGNSAGFTPGEAAAAVLVGRTTQQLTLRLEGVGYATEPARVDSEEPLRADGLTSSIQLALSDAASELHQLDFRIVDVSGEPYYFKEAALALGRTLRQRKEEFDIWHPAECIGETGSAIGPAMLAIARAACEKSYAPGSAMLVHASNDDGQRVSLVMRYWMG